MTILLAAPSSSALISLSVPLTALTKIFSQPAAFRASCWRCRPGLAQALEILRRGDTPVVWRLDRLWRSLKDLIGWVHTLETQGVEFKSLQEAIDTVSPSGKLTFHLFAALAEFERNLIRERTQAGLRAARARGRRGGRPKALDKDKRALAAAEHA